MRGSGHRGVVVWSWLLPLCLAIAGLAAAEVPSSRAQEKAPAGGSAAGSPADTVEAKKPAPKKKTAKKKAKKKKSAKKAGTASTPDPAAKTPASGAKPAVEAPAPAGRSAAAPSAPSRGKKKPARARKEPSLKISGEAEFQSIYDDNIFRFSDENLLAFRRGENPDKFKLETYDDLILSPRLTLSFGRKLFAGKETQFRVKYTLWRYLSNPDKSNEQWFLRLRQPLRGRDAMEFSYSYAPPGYIRELTDRDPFDSRATPIRWMNFKGTRNAFVLAYSGRLSNRFSYRAEAGRVHRYYNKPFLETDNWEWNGAGTLTYRLATAWSIAGKYQYSYDEARAHDTVLETFENTDDGDGSYERDLFEGTLVFSPKRFLWKVNRLEWMAQRQIYYYTSTQPYFQDPTHTGRKDTVTATEVIANTSPVYGPMALEAGWRYSTRSSTSAATDVGADAIEEDKNYEDNRLWIGVTYPF